MPNYTKTIVCLANSWRPPSGRGRCIAGKEILENGYGAWIRPVSDRPSMEISDKERRYRDGRESKILDIVEMRMVRPAPNLPQIENHVIDAGYRWRNNGELP